VVDQFGHVVHRVAPVVAKPLPASAGIGVIVLAPAVVGVKGVDESGFRVEPCQSRRTNPRVNQRQVFTTWPLLASDG
jgi:hypothetical protein